MSRSIRRGVVRNIEPPYRRGLGLEVQLGEFVVGFGLMDIRMRKTDDEDAGLARVGVLGRTHIDNTPKEIGDWDGTSPEAGDETADGQRAD